MTQSKSFLGFDVHTFANQIVTYHENFEYTKLQVFKTPTTNGKNTKAVFWKQKEINLFLMQNYHDSIAFMWNVVKSL